MDQLVVCCVCGKEFSAENCIGASFVRAPIVQLIQKGHPEWNIDSQICLSDLNRYRSEYVQDTLEQERGELSELEIQVVESLREHEVLAENVNEEFDQQSTFGNRIADRVASFGGSWTFIILFGVILVT